MNCFSENFFRYVNFKYKKILRFLIFNVNVRTLIKGKIHFLYKYTVHVFFSHSFDWKYDTHQYFHNCSLTWKVWVSKWHPKALLARVLARISKLPVQNINFKISARPDLATNLLQMLTLATINSVVCQKGQFTLQLCPRGWFVKKIFGYFTPKATIEKSS